MKLTQLKKQDLTEIREKILEEQGNKCALCKEEIHEKSGAAVDHQHMTSKEKLGENGAGLVRGVLCRRCNVFEGKIWNSSKRFGLNSGLSDWLRDLADYLDKENYPLIHPNEEPKSPPVSKRQYNALKKKYNAALAAGTKKAKFPEFPKSKKLLKDLASLFEEFEISPYT